MRLANGLPVAVSARENLDELTRSTKSRDTNKATSNRTRIRKQNPEKLVSPKKWNRIGDLTI